MSLDLTSIYADQRRFNLPSLYTNEAFGIEFPIANAPGESLTYTGKSILLTIDLIPTGPTPTRVIIPNGDSGISISVDGLTLTILKPASWTLDNLTPGNWVYTLWVGSDADREVYAWGSFAVVTAPGGNL